MGKIISITKKKTKSQQEPAPSTTNTTTGQPELQQQARAALTAHYARKGLKGDELTQTVDKVMAVQFRPQPEYANEYPFATEEQLRKVNADLKRELADRLREMEPASQSVN